MPKFPLDLSKFKAATIDDKCATLSHEDGHSIKIAIKALNPRMKDKLNKLFPQPKKMAKGGEALSIEPATDEEIKNKDKKPLQIEPVVEEKQLDIVPAPEVDQKPLDIVPAEGASGPVGPEEPKPDPMMEAYSAAYNQWKSNNPASPDDVAREQGYAAVERLKAQQAQGAIQTQEAEQKSIAENQKRQALGLPPLEGVKAQPMMTMAGTSPVPVQPPAIPIQSQAAEQAPKTGLTPSLAIDQIKKEEKAPSLEEGYKKSQQSINELANAEIEQQHAQQRVLAHNIAQEQDHFQRYQREYNALNSERKAFIKDIQESHIDPNRYWKDHSKVASIIGVILGGFNPTNSPNAVMEMIQHNLDQDIKAQEKELDQKNNLLSANYHAFGNLNDATQMTRVMQADMLSNQLKQAAAKASDPVIKARALSTAGQLEMSVAPTFQKLAIGRALEGLVQEANTNPAKIPSMLSAMRQVDPKRAEDLEQKYVPGMGFALTPKDASEVKELKGTVDTALKGIGDLKKLNNKPLSSLNITDRATAQSIALAMQGILRVPITGPGAVTPEERGMLRALVPDPTKIFSLSVENRAKFLALEKKLKDGLNLVAKARGINLPDPVKQLPPQQQAFANWARQNLNSSDPEKAKKAQMVIQKLGLD